MAYCLKCGKALPDDATVCTACGASFDPMPDPVYDPPKKEKQKTKSASKSPEVKNAFRKWANDQGMFCLIAKAVAVTVMAFYLLTGIVSTISLIVEKASGGAIFSTLFLDLLAGIVYGVVIWLLSDAVLYLRKLYEMKKNEMKNK